jgi:hypothetical protein
MLPNEHYNQFCNLFAEIKKLTDAGKKDSKEARDMVFDMYKHYKYFTDPMVKFMEKYTNALLMCGFSFDEMSKIDQLLKVDVSDLDRSKEVQVSGNFKCAKLVNADPRGKIYNYNEYSKPFNQLPPNEFQILKKRTLENVIRERQMIDMHITPKQNRQPKTWGLTDAEKDWS